MKWLYRIGNRTAGYVVVLMLVLIVAGIVTYGVLVRLLPPGDPAWTEMRCYIGLPLQGDDECWQARLERRESVLEARHEKRMAALEGRHQKRMAAVAAKQQKVAEALKRARRRERELEDKRKELADRLGAAERIEANWSDINLFTKEAFLGGSVHTGVKYPSIVEGKVWDHSWCYFSLPGSGALEKKIDLGDASPSTGVSWSEVSNAELREAGISRAELKQAQAKCSWPEEVASSW